AIVSYLSSHGDVEPQGSVAVDDHEMRWRRRMYARLLFVVVGVFGAPSAVIASEAKQTHLTCACVRDGDCFVAPRAPRNDNAKQKARACGPGLFVLALA